MHDRGDFLDHRPVGVPEGVQQEVPIKEGLYGWGYGEVPIQDFCRVVGI